VNSTRVIGGAPPAPLHGTCPELQSPVAHLNFPVESLEQSVHGQKSLDHDFGVSREEEVKEGNINPVEDNGEEPLAVKTPGHIV
ncbi:hypothetical protein Ancab_039402, partial [Ancistrocladus abbreviatus]